MKKLNRTHWKKGIVITPESFLGMDNYHIAERIMLGRFLTSRSYGILPAQNFYVEKTLVNNRIYIKNLECRAITQDGYMINIPSDKPLEKEIELSNIAPELYVVLTVNPFLPEDESKLSNFIEYDLELKKTNEKTENGIPIIKLIQEQQSLMIDQTYIPPSIALNSVEILLKKYTEIKNTVNSIIAKIPDNYSFYSHLIMLQLELQNYSSHESPEQFVLLLKKFCWIFQSFLKSTKKIEEFPVLQRFMAESYRHNEIEKVMHSGLQSLTEFNEMIEAKPKVVEDVFEIKL
jgi:predicted component of type VI protein secretion system